MVVIIKIVCVCVCVLLQVGNNKSSTWYMYQGSGCCSMVKSTALSLSEVGLNVSAYGVNIDMQ